ncbi:MAG: hypothetical protein ABF328_07000, partial [Akkermansiaceae bacterium]
WMSYQRNMAAGERVRVYFTPERPKPGEFVSLSANAFSKEGAPLEEGSVFTDLIAPNGQVRRLELDPENESGWGNFTGRFKVDQPGTWKLKAFVSGDEAAAVETKIISQSDAIEKTGLPARLDTLEELAKVSKGKVVTANQLEQLVTEINALPEPQPLVTSTKLWAHWLAPTFLIMLLALFWVGRKLNGTF